MAKPPFISLNQFLYRERFNHHSSRVIDGDCQRAYDAEVNPPQLYFGTINVGETSASQSIVVTNVGYRTLPILSVQGVGDFTVTSEHPASIEPGETFIISVMFVPVRAGAASGGVYVDTGDAAGKEFVMLMGAGEGENSGGSTGDDFTLSPTSLAFGTVAVDEDSTARTVTVTNNTTSAITMTLAVTGMFSLNKTSLTVPAMGTATFAVTFSPTSTGAKTGSVAITTTATGTKTLGLTGTGAAAGLPVVTLTGVVIEEVSDTSSVSSNVTSLAFGAVSVGETSIERSVVLTNSGGVAAEITALSATGDFTITSGAVGDTVPAGGTLIIKVTFTPSGEGDATGSLVIGID